MLSSTKSFGSAPLTLGSSVATKSKADDTRSSAPDDDHLGIDAVLLKQAFLFCNPDAALDLVKISFDGFEPQPDIIGNPIAVTIAQASCQFIPDFFQKAFSLRLTQRPCEWLSKDFKPVQDISREFGWSWDKFDVGNDEARL